MSRKWNLTLRKFIVVHESYVKEKGTRERKIMKMAACGGMRLHTCVRLRGMFDLRVIWRSDTELRLNAAVRSWDESRWSC